MNRIQQVIVVQEHSQAALRAIQTQVGCIRTPKWLACARGSVFSIRPAKPHGQAMARVDERAVRLASRVNDHDFDVGIGLGNHAGNGLREADTVHTSDNDANQRQLAGAVGQMQAAAHIMQRRRSLTDPALAQCSHSNLKERLGSKHCWPHTKRAHGSHGLRKCAVRMHLLLRNKRL